MESEISSENQLDSAYFLKLAAVLIILGAVYFSSSFTNTKNKNTTNNQPNNPSENETIYASVLPLSQDAFLAPVTDAVIPIRKWSVPEPEFSAQSVWALESNSGKVLFQKEPGKTRPIASLSKLMTALIVIERANLRDEIVVSKNAIDTYGEMGNLVVNEKISIESLLYALLVESSNDAAVALAEKFNGQFVNFMNEKAKSLGLKNTLFSDPSGLSTENISNVQDLAKLMQEVIKYPFLNQIMKTAEIDIHSADGKDNHHLINSNKLLAKYPEIIAGKTGYIDEAGGCIILVLKSPNGQGIIINVILGSQDRLGEMDKLIQWEREAYIW